MRRTFFAVFGIVLGSLVLSAPASWAAAPKAQQSGQTAGVYKVAIDSGVSLDDAAQSMRLRANALNLKLVAELPLSKQVEAVTGKPQRTITIFQFCDAVRRGHGQGTDRHEHGLRHLHAVPHLDD